MPTSHSVEYPAELLAFLFANWSDVKKTKLRQWLKHGAVQVNGRSITRFNHPLDTRRALDGLPHGRTELDG